MARKDISNKLMILGSDRKKHQNSVVQQNSSVRQTKVIPDLRMLGKGILLETTTLLVYFLWLVVFANNRIADHLQISGLFSDFQDGFRSSWSITDLLIELLGIFNRSHLIYPRLLKRFGIMVFFTNLTLMEFQIKYLALFLLFS